MSNRYQFPHLSYLSCLSLSIPPVWILLSPYLPSDTNVLLIYSLKCVSSYPHLPVLFCICVCTFHWEYEIYELSYLISLISGSCGHDGVYIQDADSLVLCSNGIAYYQPCPPGTKNSGYNSQYDDHYTSGSYYNLDVRQGHVITSHNVCGIWLRD